MTRTTLPRWVRRPEGANWGDFGADDQLGRLNLLTREKVLQGAAEVREGLNFCLSLPLDVPRGNGLIEGRSAPRLSPTRGPGDAERFNRPSDTPHAKDVFCDDEVTLCLQYSSQWDALCHAGQRFDADGDGVAEIVYYNGFRAGEHILGRDANGRHVGALKLGIETMAEKPIQGRGVMIDVRSYLGAEWRPVDWDDIAAILTRDHIEIEPGDMVCMRTGWSDMLLAMPGTPDPAAMDRNVSGLDSRDPRVLDWISRSGISALISDDLAVEHWLRPQTPPTSDFVVAPIHELCLFKLGIPLGELWHLSPLADWLRAHGRTRFMLTAPPLRLPGAVGSPANAIGTV